MIAVTAKPTVFAFFSKLRISAEFDSFIGDWQVAPTPGVPRCLVTPVIDNSTDCFSLDKASFIFILFW